MRRYIGAAGALWRWSRGRAGLAVVAAALCVGCGSGDGSAEGREGPADRPADPQVVPDYSAITLDGDSVSLGDLRGDVVLLNVWATWCTPCRKEIPELQALHEARADEGLRVVGVTVDARHAEEGVRRFIDRFGMTYDVWWDPDQTIVGKLGAMGVPLTVLIDRNGRVIWRKLGPLERDDPGLMRAVEQALRPASRETSVAT